MKKLILRVLKNQVIIMTALANISEGYTLTVDVTKAINDSLTEVIEGQSHPHGD